MTPAGALAVLAAGAVFLQLGVALVAGRARRRPRARPSTRPSCAVVVPTKGAPRGFVQNVEALAGQAYPGYRVYFVVEAEGDAGLAVLRDAARRYAHVQVVVAGLSTTTCQQNHNMLAGVAAAGPVEVLAFADNDVAPPPDWLASLVDALGEPGTTVATGYRWLVAPAGRLGEQVQVAMNITMYAWFLAACDVLGRGLWGGSFALRHADFVRLEVAAAWDRAVSDDVTLMGCLERAGLRSRFAPGVVIVSDDVLASPRAAVAWFERQLLNLKAHAPGLWGLALAGLGLVGVLLALLPLAAAAHLSGLATFAGAGGWAGAGFWAGECVRVAVVAAQGPTRGALGLVAGAPLLRLAEVAAAARTLGRRHLTWAGTRYHFDARGRLARIERGPA